ncbi:hypothetical protein F5148DRAFT_1313088 [Russula earlei]|uniref:Uncharacterized protein n=1 Tax=Russula earlei TaxID=71964 RepID=A0ACC0TRP3_9AGAM|nr:hypothetical protein F5148DRAFT_1313088 [Russula earlei]
MNHFKKHWDLQLQEEVLTLAQHAFKECYKQLQTTLSMMCTTTPAVKWWKPNGLLCDVDSEDEENDDTDVYTPSTAPWMIEFNYYLITTDIIPLGMMVVEWWGINAPRYPIATSLAHDYLAIMLNGDVMEALQCLKCMYHNDLIFQDVMVATEEEAELEEMDLELAKSTDDADEGFTWDQILADDEMMYQSN